MEDDLNKLDDDLLEVDEIPPKKVPFGDVYEAARAGDVDRLRVLLDSGVNVNARDTWDSVALYYACLAGHVDAARMLLDNGAICSEHTFDGDRCHYAALNLRIRRLLKEYEARPLPLPPLADALYGLFFRCGDNYKYLDPTLVDAAAVMGNVSSGDGVGELIGADIVFHVDEKDISAHRAVLAARSPFFRRKFESVWRFKKVVRLVSERLSFSALFSLISFFYCDKLDVLVDDMEDLVRICKVCECFGLRKILQKEMLHQKYAEYKSYKLSKLDDSVRRFILQGSSLPEEDRLPAAMDRLLRACLDKSGWDEQGDKEQAWEEDFADACFVVEETRFRCHQAALVARSDYIRATLGFRNDMNRQAEDDGAQVFEEPDFSMDTFVKLLRYMYTDVLEEIDLEQAEEILDAASRYLLFPLKRMVADVVLSYLENATPSLVCQWLIISDAYGVTKVREHCLDVIAVNFESFACASEFKSMVRRLPPPSGDSSTRTSAPGAQGTQDQGNLLDDLRETWLNAEGAELHERDQSAKEFDEMLQLLRESAEDDGETS